MIVDILRAREIFLEISALDESVFPLDRAALAIGLEEYPSLDTGEYLRRFDLLAARAEVLLGHDHEPADVIECLNQILFVQEGLRGNTEDYYDPRNSFLNEVLESRQGIPISLSVIYMEVARRIGFPIQGIGFPGHFMVRHETVDREIFIDPFNLGRIVSLKDCQELLDRIYGGTITVQPAHLQPMSKKAVITRMLFNLKGIYYQKEEFQKALAMVERVLMLNPGILSEIRDRGLLFMQTSLFSNALADLEHYLAEAGAPEDGAYIEAHIKMLRSIVAVHN